MMAERLRLDGTPIIVDDTLHGAGFPNDVKYSPTLHLGVGYHLIESIYFECGGGSSGEVFLVDANNNPIALVGDVANGGLEVAKLYPSPASSRCWRSVQSSLSADGGMASWRG